MAGGSCQGEGGDREGLSALPIYAVTSIHVAKGNSTIIGFKKFLE